MSSYGISQARQDLPTRGKSDNKTRGGKCLVIAGSPGMWGAAVLTATAAARMGAGYVYLKPGKGDFPSTKHPDFLTARKLTGFTAAALGPGLSAASGVSAHLRRLLRDKTENVVLDAEALNALSRMKKKPRIPSSWILTPHEGELARLLGVSSNEIRKDRASWARKAQAQLGGILLLKGSPTLVTDGKKLWEIKSGNPALAKAGTGDVLTGLILALLGQKLLSLKAACLGAFIHGAVADDWIRGGRDILSLMASDIPRELPFTLARIRKGRD